MDVGVLGPLTVSLDGRDVALDRPKERALLSALVLGRGSPVGRERLIDALWGDAPPRLPAEALRAHVRRVRAVVGRDAIGTTTLGYECAITTSIDADALREAVRCGGDAAVRAEVLGRALTRWRGRPYDDLGDWHEVVPERRGLEELRAHALEDWAAARLELGEAAGIVPLLEELVAEQPLHERRWELLMRALYEAGRPADALRAFQRARRFLAEDGGLEPGRTLVDLDRAIATNDLVAIRSDRSGRVRPSSVAHASVAQVLRAAVDNRRGGRDSEAQLMFERAELLARASSDKTELAAVAVAMSADGWLSGLNPGTHVLTLLDEAIARLPPAPTALRSRLLARLAVAGGSNRDSALVASQSKESLGIARMVGDPPTLLSALYARLVTQHDPAAIDECTGLAREMLELGGGDANARPLALSSLARLRARVGEVEEAARLAAEAEVCAKGGAADVVLATLWYPLFRATLAGNVAAALEIAGAIGEVGRRALTDPEAAQAMEFAIKMLVAAVFAGDGPGNAALSVRLDELSWPLENLAHIARAGVALLVARNGEIDAARAILGPVSSHDLSNLARDSYWPGVVWAVTSVTHLTADAERAEVLMHGVRPFAGQLLIDPAGIFLGCTDHHLGVLAATCGRNEEARCHLRDATAVYQRVGASWWAERSEGRSEDIASARRRE